MGARQSKRSVDITTTPKKDGLPNEGSVAGDAAAPGDGKLERIEETDGKPITNGTAPHSDVPVPATEDKDKDKDQEKEKEKDEDTEKEDAAKNESKEETRTPESTKTDNPEAVVVAEEATTPTDNPASPTSPDSATSPESKDAKKKDKKKKWSFRSLSFGKRDRSKTASREDAPKNGDVTKEEPLAEGGEEAEAAVPVEESPAEEKADVSSPTEESVPAAAPVKEEEKAAPASPTPVEEKKEEPTPAPTPVPVEEKKEEVEKVEPVVAEKVEVSPVQAISAVEVTQAQPVATPSIIERKTSEDIPPPLPSSPPPTPIDPSPLQRAQHAAANASALAEALKVPAEAASMASQIAKEPVKSSQAIDESETTVVTDSSVITSKVTSESLPPVTITEQLAQVTDSSRDHKISTISQDPQSIPEPVKECEIISEVIKSNKSDEIQSKIISPVSSANDTIAEQIDNTLQSTEMKGSLKTESQKIVENGVSGLDSAPPENIISLTKDSSDLGKVESLIEVQGGENEVCKKRDLVIQSEEGPLPLSQESLVEAKPAVVVPEDDFMESVIKTVETIDLQNVEEKSDSIDIVLESDKIPISESDSNKQISDEDFVSLEKTEINSPEFSSQVETSRQTQNESIISAKTELIEEIVPPLPESPIPNLEKSQDIGKLLSEKIDNSITLKEGICLDVSNLIVEHAESEVVFDPIEELRASHMSAEGLGLPKESLPELSSSVTASLNVSASYPLEEKNSINDTPPDFLNSPLPAKDISNPSDDLPVPPEEIFLDTEVVKVCPLPSKNLSASAENVSDVIVDPDFCPISKATLDPESVVENGSPITEPSSPKIPNDAIVSPPCIPSPAEIPLSQKESSQSQIIGNQSNEEFEVESLSQSLNSYNDSDVQLKERLAELEGMNGVENTPSCPLLRAVPTAELDNAQKITEPEIPAENPAEVSATESVIEAPAVPALPLPSEVPTLPVLPLSEPAITEDVASVTKAIEEIDISDKAVAAAVNEAIESANTNEIVTDSHHQNVVKE